MTIGDLKMMKINCVGVFTICTVVATALGAGAGFTAQADDLATGLHSGVNQLRQTCGAIGEDARLTAAAQRHANDMLKNTNYSHTGTDGSSPRVRIVEAGYGGAGPTGEIVYWGSGAASTASSALAFWMESSAHRAIILNCAFTAGGFATAWDGNMMTAVVDFAAP